MALILIRKTKGYVRNVFKQKEKSGAYVEDKLIAIAPDQHDIAACLGTFPPHDITNCDECADFVSQKTINAECVERLHRNNALMNDMYSAFNESLGYSRKKLNLVEMRLDAMHKHMDHFDVFDRRLTDKLGERKNIIDAKIDEYENIKTTKVEQLNMLENIKISQELAGSQEHDMRYQKALALWKIAEFKGERLELEHKIKRVQFLNEGCSQHRQQRQMYNDRILEINDEAKKHNSKYCLQDEALQKALQERALLLPQILQILPHVKDRDAFLAPFVKPFDETEIQKRNDYIEKLTDEITKTKERVVVNRSQRNEFELDNEKTRSLLKQKENRLQYLRQKANDKKAGIDVDGSDYPAHPGSVYEEEFDVEYLIMKVSEQIENLPPFPTTNSSFPKIWTKSYGAVSPHGSDVDIH